MGGLIVTVGVGVGDHSDIPPVIDSLARSVAGASPSLLGALVTAESRRYAHVIADRAGVRAIEEVVSDPDDLEGCFAHALRLIDHLLDRGAVLEDLGVDVTSGTAAMRAGTVLAAATRHIRRYRLIGGERRGGLIVTGSETFRDIEPSVFFAEADLMLAEELIRRFRFGAARQVLERGKRHRRGQRSRRRAAVLQKVAHLYQMWDLFQHGKAWRTYQQAEREGSLGEFVLPEPSRDHLASLAAGGRSYIGAADLMANAFRRAEEGRFDDATARLYRCLELIAQVALLEDCGLDHADLDVARIVDPQLAEELRATASPDRDGRLRVRMALMADLRVLRDQGHPLGELADDQELRSLLEARNKSILAHGTVPVRRQTFEQLATRVVGAGSVVEPRFGELVGELQFPWASVGFPRVGGAG